MTTGTSGDDLETVQVRFSPEVLDRVDESVGTGEYATRSELVGAAIRAAANE